jgi:hypothetical protein
MMMKVSNTQFCYAPRFLLQIVCTVILGIALYPCTAVSQWALGERRLVPIPSGGSRPEVHVAADSVYIVYRTNGRPGAFKLAVLDTHFSQFYRERTLVETTAGGNVTDIRINAGLGAVYMAYEITPSNNVATQVRLERVTPTFDATGDIVTVTDRDDKTYGNQFLDDAPVLVHQSKIFVLTKLGGGAPANQPYRFFEFQQTINRMIFVRDGLIETSAQVYPGVSFIKTETPLLHSDRILLVYGMEVRPGICSSAPRNTLDADIVLHEYTTAWQPGDFHILPPVPGPDGEPDAIETYPVGFAASDQWLFIVHVALHRSLYDCSGQNADGHSPDGGTLWFRALNATTLQQVDAVQLTNLQSGETFVSKHPTIAVLPDGRLWVVSSSNENADSGQLVYAQEILLTTTSVDSHHGQPPESFALQQNYPNPFNPKTTIRFTLPRSQHVTLKVYDILGKEVVTLADGKFSAGEHTLIFDATNRASGVYLYQIAANNFMQVRKMILMR